MLDALKNLFTSNSEVEVEEDDEFDFDEFGGEDEWEDREAIEKIKAKYPGWFIVKAVDFTYGTMAEMKQWCVDNTTDEYAHVGWYSGCSYTVGVTFKSHVDAILFKLTWSGE